MSGLRENWSEKMVARLRALHIADQHTVRQIASVLNREFGSRLTHSAVIGKLHRSGIMKEHPTRRPGRPSLSDAKRPKPIVVRTEANLGACKKSTKATTPPKFDDEKSATAVRLIDANDNQCRWPVSGSGSSLMVCGAKIAHGAYCEKHSHANGDPERRPRKVVHRRLFTGWVPR